MNKSSFASKSISRLSAATLSVALGLLATLTTSAHPGHDLHEESVAHALTSPYHLLTLALIGGGLLLGAVFVKRLAARRTMQITGATAVVVAAITFASQHLN
jgi:formate-dependent nitrite reductase membrane component NrfD